MLENLKREVLKASLMLSKYGLVTYAGGAASACESRYGLVVINPSGVPFEDLKAEDLLVLDMDGNVLEGESDPAPEIKTHLEIYKAFTGVSGVVNTVSPYAVAWAQAKRDIPCYGAIHAKRFYGAVPCTRLLKKEELSDFEKNTGKVIAETFKSRALDPAAVPAVLCAGYAPFCWGKTVGEAAVNAATLEDAAKAAVLTEKIDPNTAPFSNMKKA